MPVQTLCNSPQPGLSERSITYAYDAHIYKSNDALHCGLVVPKLRPGPLERVVSKYRFVGGVVRAEAWRLHVYVKSTYGTRGRYVE